jgi:hypothetical protein
MAALCLPEQIKDPILNTHDSEHQRETILKASDHINSNQVVIATSTPIKFTLFNISPVVSGHWMV